MLKYKQNARNTKCLLKQFKPLSMHVFLQLYLLLLVFIAVSGYNTDESDASRSSIDILLKPFSNNHCLIHLTNYQQVQSLSFYKYPLVSRNLAFYNRKFYYIGTVLHKPQYYADWIPVSWNTTFMCTSSTYFHYDPNNRNGMCIALVFKLMVLRSKPLN